MLSVMSSIVELIFTILFIAVIVLGGERLLALFPGYEKLKQVVRILAIVAVALWFLSVAALFFGVSLPWSFGASVHRRH
jgi:hypothetical protein